MDRLWAPWRKTYIRPEGRKGSGCLFCRMSKESSLRDKKNLILKRSRYHFAVLNLYPYNNGHVLIVPLRHLREISQMTNEEKLDWLGLFEEVQSAIAKTMKADGFNIGMNLGRAAGAGIPKHAHLHIVPRWIGDSNFMPLVAKTKVISESLDSVYDLLKKELCLSVRPKKKRRG